MYLQLQTLGMCLQPAQSLLNDTPSTRRLYYYVINVNDVIELFGLIIPEGFWKSRSMSTLGARKEGKKEGKGNV